MRSFCHTVWKKTDNSRLEFPDYVLESCGEALVNAIVHRDYRESRREINVDIFDDRMEICSPGGKVDGSKVQDLDPRSIPSRRRNPVIAEIFERLGYMKSLGSGLRAILERYEHALIFNKSKEPKFRSDASSFIVTLPNLNYMNEGLEAMVGKGFSYDSLRRVNAACASSRQLGGAVGSGARASPSFKETGAERVRGG